MGEKEIKDGVAVILQGTNIIDFKLSGKPRRIKRNVYDEGGVGVDLNSKH